MQAYAHNSLAFSPFFQETLAVASGTNFSLVGNGRVHIVKIGAVGATPGTGHRGEGPSNGLGVVRAWDTQDGVWDVAWNEGHEHQVAAALGNGAIKLFDVTLEGLPIQAWHEHAAEIPSVEWNNLDKTLFCTGSWDQTVKIWTPSRQTSILTIPAHSGQIYSAQWCPHSSTTLASCASDGLIRIWDTRQPTAPGGKGNAVSEMLPSGGDEILSCDWNKYTHNLLAFSSKDGGIGTLDLRQTGRGGGQVGVGVEPGARGARQVGRGKLGARKVRWDPHNVQRLASSGYDMSVRIWQTHPAPRQLFEHNAHTEFVLGLEWSLFDPGLVGSAGWDGDVHLYRV